MEQPPKLIERADVGIHETPIAQADAFAEPFKRSETPAATFHVQQRIEHACTGFSKVLRLVCPPAASAVKSSGCITASVSAMSINQCITQQCASARDCSRMPQNGSGNRILILCFQQAAENADGPVFVPVFTRPMACVLRKLQMSFGQFLAAGKSQQVESCRSSGG